MTTDAVDPRELPRTVGRCDALSDWSPVPHSQCHVWLRTFLPCTLHWFGCSTVQECKDIALVPAAYNTLGEADTPCNIGLGALFVFSGHCDGANSYFIRSYRGVLLRHVSELAVFVHGSGMQGYCSCPGGIQHPGGGRYPLQHWLGAHSFVFSGHRDGANSYFNRSYRGVLLRHVSELAVFVHGSGMQGRCSCPGGIQHPWGGRYPVEHAFVSMHIEMARTRMSRGYIRVFAWPSFHMDQVAYNILGVAGSP